MKAVHFACRPWGKSFAFVSSLFALLLMFGCSRGTPDAMNGGGPSAQPASAATESAEGPVETPTAGGDTAESAAPTTASESTKPQTDSYLPLVGRWVRTDSPYVIEIRGVGRDGSMEAAYFNPKPINVSRAMARNASGELQVFVELRDVNYPGATYNLVYSRTQDSLQGVYFQPALGQGFDVVFARVAVEASSR